MSSEFELAASQIVRQYLCENFLFGASARRLRDDASLMETGVLDSTGVMELVVFLERQFGIKVADADLLPENLDSIDRICRYLARKGAAPQPCGGMGS